MIGNLHFEKSLTTFPGEIYGLKNDLRLHTIFAIETKRSERKTRLLKTWVKPIRKSTRIKTNFSLINDVERPHRIELVACTTKTTLMLVDDEKNSASKLNILYEMFFLVCADYVIYRHPSAILVSKCVSLSCHR